MSEKKQRPKSSPKTAKVKEKESPSPKVERSEAPSSQAPAASQADPYDGKIYTIGSWKRMPNYECMFCGYATVNHRSALEHATEFHAPPQKEIVDTGIVDEDGSPITRAVQPEREI